MAREDYCLPFTAASHTSETPIRITVVGGGTAGWLAAMYLQKSAYVADIDVELTVIESSRILTIGIGQGTTSVFKGFLDELGIDELDFLRETEATIKYGIRHRDWANLNSYYDGPIDDPHRMLTRSDNIPSPWLNIHSVATGTPVGETHLFYYLMLRSRAPYILRGSNNPLRISPFTYAYHFDQALVGRYLRSQAKRINHLDALVNDAKINPDNGHINALVLDDGSCIDVDFVVDCTGIRQRIIGDILGAKWLHSEDLLSVNRAMPFFLEFNERDEIPPFTLAWAQKSGWMWQIPTQLRMSCGYVYSDFFTSPEEAQVEIENVLGRKIEPRADIRINSGRLDKSWIKNCLALGLSQSLFEPLEATSIHGTIVQLYLFSTVFFKKSADPIICPQHAFNLTCAKQVDDFQAFINLHYVSNRRDSPFWRHVAEHCIDEYVKIQLDIWSDKVPTAQDFSPLPRQIPHIDDVLYYPVLDGLGLINQNVMRNALASDARQRIRTRKAAAMLTRKFRISAAKATGHREFLNWLHS